MFLLSKDLSSGSPQFYPNYRATFVIGAMMVVALGAAFIFHWDVVYWATDRPRIPALIILAVSGAIIVASPWVIGAARLPSPSRRNGAILAAAVIAIVLVLAYWSMSGYVFSGDEVTYQFQADTFRAGRLFNPVPPLGRAMGVSYEWVANGKWMGQYPPGWPAVLAAFQRIGAPSRSVNAILVLATGYAIWRLTRMRADREYAWLAVLLFTLSPFALFQGQSLFSHPLAGLLAAVAMFFAARTRRDGRASDALLTGVLIGALGITRNIAAVAAIGAVLVEVFPYPRHWKRLFWIGVGGVPFLLILLAYQYQITGDAFEPVYYLGGRRLDHLYFDLPSIKIALLHSVEAAFELALYTSPVVPILWGIGVFEHLKNRTWSGIDLLFPIGVGLFCFYPLHPGIRFGPRYWYDFWPMAIVTLCSGLPHMRASSKGVCRAWVTSSAIYGVVCTAMLAFAMRPVSLEHTVIYRAAVRQHLSNAIVLVDNLPSYGVPLQPWTFARNGIRADGPVLFIDEGVQDALQVSRAYPGRSLWIYTPLHGGDGVLIPLTPDAAQSHGV